MASVAALAELAALWPTEPCGCTVTASRLLPRWSGQPTPLPLTAPCGTIRHVTFLHSPFEPHEIDSDNCAREINLLECHPREFRKRLSTNEIPPRPQGVMRAQQRQLPTRTLEPGK
jgi:hypothetical protein